MANQQEMAQALTRFKESGKPILAYDVDWSEREYALVALLVAFGVAGRGDAVVLSAASRVWLTLLEVLPGVVSLFWLSPSQRAALRQSS